MHGVTMIFLYALPVLSGFSNYLLAAAAGFARHGVPAIERALLLGISASPGIFLYCSFPLGKAPNDGWFNYVPYASLAYNPGP